MEAVSFSELDVIICGERYSGRTSLCTLLSPMWRHAFPNVSVAVAEHDAEQMCWLIRNRPPPRGRFRLIIFVFSWASPGAMERTMQRIPQQELLRRTAMIAVGTKDKARLAESYQEPNWSGWTRPDVLRADAGFLNVFETAADNTAQSRVTAKRELFEAEMGLLHQHEPLMLPAPHQRIAPHHQQQHHHYDHNVEEGIASVERAIVQAMHTALQNEKTRLEKERRLTQPQRAPPPRKNSHHPFHHPDANKRRWQPWKVFCFPGFFFICSAVFFTLCALFGALIALQPFVGCDVPTMCTILSTQSSGTCIRACSFYPLVNFTCCPANCGGSSCLVSQQVQLEVQGSLESSNAYLAQNFPVGSVQPCWFRPTDGRGCFYYNRMFAYTFLAFAGLFFVVSGLSLMWALVLRKKRNITTPPPPALPVVTTTTTTNTSITTAP